MLMSLFRPEAFVRFIYGAALMAAAPVVFAQNAPAAAPGFGMQQVLLMAVLFAAGYFILFAPAGKARKQQQALLDNLKVGDRVLLTSGIFGQVHQIREEIVHLRVAENTRIEVLKSTISKIIAPEEAGG